MQSPSSNNQNTGNNQFPTSQIFNSNKVSAFNVIPTNNPSNINNTQSGLNTTKSQPQQFENITSNSNVGGQNAFPFNVRLI